MIWWFRHTSVATRQRIWSLCHFLSIQSPSMYVHFLAWHLLYTYCIYLLISTPLTSTDNGIGCYQFPFIFSGAKSGRLSVFWGCMLNRIHLQCTQEHNGKRVGQDNRKRLILDRTNVSCPERLCFRVFSGGKCKIPLRLLSSLHFLHFEGYLSMK